MGESTASVDEIGSTRLPCLLQQHRVSAPTSGGKAVAAGTGASSTDRVPVAASVRVVARLRPRLSHEVSGELGAELLTGGKALVLTDGKMRRQFVLDQVFGCRNMPGERQTPCDTQAYFFGSFGQSFVADSLAGCNVCLLTHGHTGSEKLYTMMGGVDRFLGGLLPRFLRAFFDERGEDSAPSSWNCSCRFFEVYNEQIRDLLQLNQAPGTCRLRVHPIHGAFVEGLTTPCVGSISDALGFLDLGNRRRAVAATGLNSCSSRSHAFFSFRYKQTTAETGAVRESLATFVDLAGKEDRRHLASAPGGALHREICAINTSLFHLANLIKILSLEQNERSSLKYFRNSLLTMLLAPAMSGNCRMGVIATLSPMQWAFKDSLSTMRFATSVMKIETKSEIHIQPCQAVIISQLKAEVCCLREQLHSAHSSSSEIMDLKRLPCQQPLTPQGDDNDSRQTCSGFASARTDSRNSAPEKLAFAAQSERPAPKAMGEMSHALEFCCLPTSASMLLLGGLGSVVGASSGATLGLLTGLGSSVVTLGLSLPINGAFGAAVGVSMGSASGVACGALVPLNAIYPMRAATDIFGRSQIPLAVCLRPGNCSIQGPGTEKKSSMMTTIRFSLGSAVVLGTLGAASGSTCGAFLGATLGSVAAIPTLGLSIPCSAVMGSSLGLCCGAAGGSSFGFLYGGLGGWAYWHTMVVGITQSEGNSL